MAARRVLSWALSFSTPYLTNAGPGNGAGLGPKIFFIWGSTMAFAAVFVFLCVPETRGLSLEQIDAVYRDYRIPFLSKSSPSARPSAQEHKPKAPGERDHVGASLEPQAEKQAPV